MIAAPPSPRPAARRRSAWLRLACLVLACLAAPAHATPAAPAAPAVLAPPGAKPSAALVAKPSAKKDRALQAKSTKHGAPPAAGSRPGALINLYNFWTQEWLAVDLLAPPAKPTIDHFLRDHFTNEATAMDPRLLAIVVAAATNFHSDVVNVVSGFRHPKYNLILRKKGHQVARDSQHSHGAAIDFALPRVPATTLHAWAKAQQLGGVGFYPESGFVHMDTGPIRSWSGE